MRKKRVILFDDDPLLLNMLKTFFELKNYEVLTFNGPVRFPVYHNDKCCDDRHLCGDVLITDYKMPGMTGIELLRAQTRLECRLTVRNKAIMSGSVAPAVRRTYGPEPAAGAHTKGTSRELQSGSVLSPALGDRTLACNRY